MTSRHESDSPIEHVIERALRNQPLRRAPATLAARILFEIERRAALPWWRKNFKHWPPAARIAFVLASAGFAKVALIVGTLTVSGMGSIQALTSAMPLIVWLQTLARIIDAVQNAGILIFHDSAPLWRYGLLAMFALYVFVFGAGALTYRTIRTLR